MALTTRHAINITGANDTARTNSLLDDGPLPIGNDHLLAKKLKKWLLDATPGNMRVGYSLVEYLIAMDVLILFDVALDAPQSFWVRPRRLARVLADVEAASGAFDDSEWEGPDEARMVLKPLIAALSDAQKTVTAADVVVEAAPNTGT